MEIFIRYLHFISIMGLFGAITAEHLLIKPTLSLNEVKRISILDTIYGVCAMIALLTGLLMIFVVGKPAVVYLKNYFFHIKATIFILIAVLSLYPTFFLKKVLQQVGSDDISIPKGILHVIRLELLLILILPILGILMARGIGYFGS